MSGRSVECRLHSIGIGATVFLVFVNGVLTQCRTASHLPPFKGCKGWQPGVVYLTTFLLVQNVESDRNIQSFSPFWCATSELFSCFFLASEKHI